MPGKVYIGSALLRLSEMLAFVPGSKRLKMEVLHGQLRLSPRKADRASWRISRFSPVGLTVFLMFQASSFQLCYYPNSRTYSGQPIIMLRFGFLPWLASFTLCIGYVLRAARNCNGADRLVVVDFNRHSED